MYFISRGYHGQRKRFVIGLVIIAVIDLFAGLMTISFWIGHLVGNRFPKTLPVPEDSYNAFALPDLVLAAFLLIASVGLLRFKNRLYLCSDAQRHVAI